MIPPGLLVAFTLASTPPASVDGRMGSGTATSPRALVPGGPFGGAGGVDAPLGAVGREPEAARFADLLSSLVVGHRGGPAAVSLNEVPPTAVPPTAVPPAAAQPPAVQPTAVPSAEDTAEDTGESAALAAALVPPVRELLADDLGETEGIPLADEPAALGPRAVPGRTTDALGAEGAAPSGLDVGVLATVAFAVTVSASQVVDGTGGEPPLDPTTLRGLDRDFARRLTRVAERMRSGYGRTLEVIEGVRSQVRQDALFNQGRTDPGPVVTWTTESMHTIGRAADVYVDGAPVTPESAILLARIAREEGLRTLYPIDSGHIQVDGPGVDGSPEAPMPRRADAPSPGVAAPRKGVAPVAPVAPVAEPARAGGVVARDSGGGPVEGSDAAPQSSAPGGRGGSDGTPTPPPAPAAPPLVTAAATPAVRPRTGYTPDVGSSSSPPVDPTRFETPEPLSSYRSVRLPLEGLGEGSALHVGLRGSIVDARLSVADPVVAADLSRGLHELGQQLGLKGFDVGEVAVRIVRDPAAEAVRTVVSPAPQSDARVQHGSGPAGGSSSDPGSQQGRSSSTAQDALEGRERGSRQRKDTNEERAS